MKLDISKFQQPGISVQADAGETESIVHYKHEMLDEMLQLFYNTVHTVNAKDYTDEQLDRWAPPVIDRGKWEKRLSDNLCLVAISGKQIVGFGELSTEGCIDTMYVHKNFQGKRIASRILEELITMARQRNFTVLTTDASITARPFFERHGFTVVKVQRNYYNEMVFLNYKMQKTILQ